MNIITPKKAENFSSCLIKHFISYYEYSNHKDLVYCKNSAIKAYNEALHDMQFIQTRRLIKGVGRCKVAGILLWRLYKSNFARFSGEKTCLILGKNINPSFDIALLYVLHNVLKVDPIKIKKKYKQEFDELEYQLRNRHINQESIALILKVMCKSEKLNCCGKSSKGNKK